MIRTACVIKAQGTNLRLLYVECWCAWSSSHILLLTWNSAIMSDEQWYWLPAYTSLLEKVWNKCDGRESMDSIGEILRAEYGKKGSVWQWNMH